MLGTLRAFGGALVRFAQEGPATPLAPSASGAAAAAGDAPQQQSPLFTLVFFGLIFGVFYFLIVRPQQKRTKEHTKFIDDLKVGSKVVTQAGIFGKIAAIDGNQVHLEIAPNLKIRVLKSQVAGLEANADTVVGEQSKS